MIFAHLPAGYVVARLLRNRLAEAQTNNPVKAKAEVEVLTQQRVPWKWLLAACLLGSIAPDSDLTFYLFDATRHHHLYPTHYPVVWGSLLLASVVWFCGASDKRWAVLALAFTLNAFVHLCLDSFAGSIRWLAPWSFERYALATVPRRTGTRLFDYLLYWTAWLELIPILWAAWLWRWRPVMTASDTPC